MNPQTNEFSMFAPTSSEEAARQSNPNRGVEFVVDVLKPGTPQLTWEEGDNWVRIINCWGNPWITPVEYYEMRAGNKMARVIHQNLFGDLNLLRDVQIGLYSNLQTKGHMRTRQNPEGWQFREHRKAYFVASRWENTLSPFAIASVTIGRQNKKDAVYREAWGDGLLKIPAELKADPTLPMGHGEKPEPRWGMVFCPVDGRLIKCSFTNYGTKDVTATFSPVDNKMPLGDWVVNGQPTAERPVPKGAMLVPKPQFMEVLRSAPNIMNHLNHITIEQQQELVRTFVPAHLLPFAEQIMTAKLNESRTGRRSTTGYSGSTAAPTAAAAPAAPAATPQVQLPVPVEEPSAMSDVDKLYLSFVKALGAKFAEVGEETARKLITNNLVNAQNLASMASFAPSMLKTLATAS